jgi:hypothetical protein
MPDLGRVSERLKQWMEPIDVELHGLGRLFGFTCGGGGRFLGVRHHRPV